MNKTCKRLQRGINSMGLQDLMVRVSGAEITSETRTTLSSKAIQLMPLCSRLQASDITDVQWTLVIIENLQTAAEGHQFYGLAGPNGPSFTRDFRHPSSTKNSDRCVQQA